VQLRPRRTLPGYQDGAGVSRWTPPEAQSPVDDLARYQRTSADEGDRHRMTMNVLALLICVLLIVAGLWLAGVIADMRDLRDCVVSGRHGCGPLPGAISYPH